MAHAVESASSASPSDPVSRVPVPATAAAARQRRRHLERAAQALEHGQVMPGTVPEVRQQALARGLAVHPAVAQAWLLSVAPGAEAAILPQAPGAVPVPVLMVRLDPQALERLDLHEGQVREQLQDLLDRVHPPVADWLIRISYTTEGVPPELLAQVERLPPLPSLHRR